MHLFNTLIGYLFAALMLPFRRLPLLGLVLISLLAGVGMLLLFKKVSNQASMEAVKRSIHACLFEIRLFNDDLRAILRAMLEILRRNLSYLRLQIVPLLFILPPVVILLAQLQPYFGYRGLDRGEPVLLKVEMRPAADGFSLDDRPALELQVPEGLRLETPAVWIPAKGEMTWRLSAVNPGDYELTVKSGGEVLAKSVRVSDGVVRRSPRRVSSLVDQFLYPVEAPIAGTSAVRSIAIGYPEDPYWLFMPRWMWIFFLLTVVFAFAFRKPLKVTI